MSKVASIAASEEMHAKREIPGKDEMIHGMEAAMKQAKKAYRKGTYPIGAVIVNPKGKVIGRGRNRIYSHGDYTSHAEVEAIRHAGGELMKEGNRGSCTLYTTMEPCLMCSGAILLAHIHNVVWLVSNADHGALSHIKLNEEYSLSEFYKGRLNPLTIVSLDRFDEMKEISETWKRDMEIWMEEIKERSEPWKQDMETWMGEWNQKKEQNQNTPEKLLYKGNFLLRFVLLIRAKMFLYQF